MACFVTALYPIREGYIQELATRFSELLKLLPEVPIFVWTDREWSLTDSRIVWLHFPLLSFQSFSRIQTSNPTLPDIRNPTKDTLEYIALMNTKVEMIWRCVPYSSETIQNYVWIDAGITKIFKEPLDNNQSILKLLQYNVEFQRIQIPGCWGRRDSVSLDIIHWRFCGGFFILPRALVSTFQTLSETSLSEFCLKGKIAWEVNVWAHIELEHPELFEWYAADHNNSILNCPNLVKYAT